MNHEIIIFPVASGHKNKVYYALIKISNISFNHFGICMSIKSWQQANFTNHFASSVSSILPETTPLWPCARQSFISENHILLHLSGYDNTKHKKSWVDLKQLSTSTTKHKYFVKKNTNKQTLVLYIWWFMKGLLYYKLLKLGKTSIGESFSHLRSLTAAIGKKNSYLQNRAVGEPYCFMTTFVNTLLCQSKKYNSVE